MARICNRVGSESAWHISLNRTSGVGKRDVMPTIISRFLDVSRGERGQSGVVLLLDLQFQLIRGRGPERVRAALGHLEQLWEILIRRGYIGHIQPSDDSTEDIARHHDSRPRPRSGGEDDVRSALNRIDRAINSEQYCSVIRVRSGQYDIEDSWAGGRYRLVIIMAGKNRQDQRGQDTASSHRALRRSAASTARSTSGDNAVELAERYARKSPTSYPPFLFPSESR